MDEQQLIDDLRNGNEKAFVAIYQKYQANLFIYAYRLMLDESAAADLVQELFAFVWEKRSTLYFRVSLKAYLYQSIRHRFLNYEKHQKVRSTFEAYVQKELDRGDDTTSKPLHEKELFERLELVLKKLPEKAAKAFALRQKGFSDDEIATELDVSPKTVQNLLSATRKTVHKQLKNLLNLFL